jgi:N utilization substance protein A
MSALVPAGAPVSVLQDHELPDVIVEKLASAGIGTIEKLGSMTPEELEEIPGIGPQMVERIFASVNSYYSQFEEAQDVEAAGESGVGSREAETQQAEASAGAETSDDQVTLEQSPDVAETTVAEAATPVPDEVAAMEPEAPATPHNDDPHSVSMAGAGEFDTIKDSESAS